MVKENENANARSSRIVTRSKPAVTASSAAGAAAGISRPTLASKAKAATADKKGDLNAGKRKREALGEVAVAGNKPTGPAVKGKEKEVLDGVILRPRTTTARQPLRTVTTRQTRPVKEDAIKPIREEKEVRNDRAMAVDPPAQVPLPGLTTRRSNLPSKSISAAGGRRKDGHSRVSSRTIPPSHHRIEEDEDEPAQKKRRTSPIPPEEDPRVLEEARAQAEEDAQCGRLADEMEAFANEPEADPEHSPWEDLDAEDNDDPLMVSEYVQDIFKYMKQLEVNQFAGKLIWVVLTVVPFQMTTMPNPNYMESQKELAWKMRGILTDWLIQVHVRFRLLPETLFLCVNIIDRFLSARVVSLAKLQLVGVTCLFIAAKFEEIVAPSVSHFLACADSSYTESEILQAERYVLKTLDWNLSYPNPVHFLRRVSKADDYNVKVRTLAKYLLEIGVLEWRLIAAPPSLMAAASIWLARLALGMENWVSIVIVI